MLTVEDIKKIFNNFEVEDFSFHERSCCALTIEINHSSYEIEYKTGKGSSNTEIYELFLQRVIEGINKNSRKTTGKYIETSYMRIAVIDRSNMISVFNSWIKDSIDQAKEQAIKYILEKL